MKRQNVSSNPADTRANWSLLGEGGFRRKVSRTISTKGGERPHPSWDVCEASQDITNNKGICFGRPASRYTLVWLEIVPLQSSTTLRTSAVVPLLAIDKSNFLLRILLSPVSCQEETAHHRRVNLTLVSIRGMVRWYWPISVYVQSSAILFSLCPFS